MDKIQIIEELFSYTLEYSYLLLPIIFILSKLKRDRLIIAIAAYGLIFFCFLHYYHDVPKIYRKEQQALYTLFEYSFFTYFIWHVIPLEKFKRLILLFSIPFLLFQFSYYYFFPLQKIDSVAIGVETIFILIYVFLYFQQYFRSSLSANIYEYSSFWIVVGIMIYLGFGFFFNILANHVTSEQFNKYWHFTFIPEILKNILFGLVILGFFTKKSDSKNVKTKDIPNLDMI